MTHEINARKWQRRFALGILCQTLFISVNVRADNCPADVSDLLTHQYFLDGASLAKLSYETPGQYTASVPYQCQRMSEQTYEVFGGQSVTIQDIGHNTFLHAKACVEGTYEGEQQRECVRQDDVDRVRNITKTMINRRDGSHRRSELHYRCTEGNSDQKNLTMTIQWVDALDDVSLLIRVGIVALSAIEYTEDLRLVRISSGDWEAETWGIQGTDPFSTRSFLTTVRALQERSCLFDFALEVAATFFKEQCINSHQPNIFQGSIVGHSLGGMASEYIAMNGGIGYAMEHCNANDNSVRVLSYNAIGWNPSIDGGLPLNGVLPNIYSIRVNGEILEKEFPNMRYLGHLVRYNALEDDCSSFCLHQISSVQRAICTCIFCGGVEYSYRHPNS